jgi:hypothetical protein
LLHIRQIHAVDKIPELRHSNRISRVRCDWTKFSNGELAYACFRLVVSIDSRKALGSLHFLLPSGMVPVDGECEIGMKQIASSIVAPGREVDSVAWSHFAASTQKALKEGKTFDQMKQARILDPWKKYSGDFITEDTYLETLFNSLTGQKNGKFIKHN